MPRVGLTPAAVVAEAERVVDECGLDGLTMAALAERLGVRQPSLYKHIDSVAALRRGIAVRAGRELVEVLSKAAVGRAKGDAIVAMADAHRAWALAHPARYPLTQVSPAAGDTEHQQVESDYLEALTAVLGGFGLTGADAIDAIRAFRATLHGFVSLEIGGGFTMSYDLDHSYRRVVTALVDSLARWDTTIA